MNEEQIIQDIYIIRDLETLKVVADPLRSQILEILILHPATVKQIAEKLGLTPNNLYYHINLMEKHGLIAVTETRMIANMLEKLYQATAKNLDVDPELLNFTTDSGKETINTVLTSTIDTTREDILRSLQARYFVLEKGAKEQPRRFILTRVVSRMNESRIEEFQSRLDALINDFSSADDQEGSANNDYPAYAFTVAFYPTFYFPDHAEDDQSD
jgi:DNA-binding transcriptional ArsR family regulator